MVWVNTSACVASIGTMVSRMPELMIGGFGTVRLDTAVPADLLLAAGRPAS